MCLVENLQSKRNSWKQEVEVPYYTSSPFSVLTCPLDKSPFLSIRPWQGPHIPTVVLCGNWYYKRDLHNTSFFEKRRRAFWSDRMGADRAQRDHLGVNIRILQNSIFGLPLILGLRTRMSDPCGLMWSFGLLAESSLGQMLGLAVG